MKWRRIYITTNLSHLRMPLMWWQRVCSERRGCSESDDDSPALKCPNLEYINVNIRPHRANLHCFCIDVYIYVVHNLAVLQQLLIPPVPGTELSEIEGRSSCMHINFHLQKQQQEQSKHFYRAACRKKRTYAELRKLQLGKLCATYCSTESRLGPMRRTTIIIVAWWRGSESRILSKRYANFG